MSGRHFPIGNRVESARWQVARRAERHIGTAGCGSSFRGFIFCQHRGTELKKGIDSVPPSEPGLRPARLFPAIGGPPRCRSVWSARKNCPARWAATGSSSAWGAAASAKSGRSRPPAGCSRRKVRLRRPRGDGRGEPAGRAGAQGPSPGREIRHPYILSLERFDIIDGQLIIVMELADRNLWDRFRECRAQGGVGIPREELLRYMEEAAEALDLMNNQYQIQHLDIKPQNLFLVFNHVKVADFGLAKVLEGVRATVTGGVTPVYAAPETFEGWVRASPTSTAWRSSSRSCSPAPGRSTARTPGSS